MYLSISQITEFSRALTIVPARNPHYVVQKLSWDTRQFYPDMLFMALKGEKLDGNDYIIDALEKGAAVVIASRQANEAERHAARQKGAALLYAADGVKALQQLAFEYRKTLNTQVIGITGSSGKTSTRQFVSAVTEKARITVASLANRNNEIGLPATVLSASPSCEVLVLEMAMRGLGQIAELCAIALPQIGIVTNIGTAHLELLGTRENIARAKAELIEALPNNEGIAILNGDDPYTPLVRELALTESRAVKTITFGIESHNDVRGEFIEYNQTGCPTFDLVLPDRKPQRVQIAVAGRHSVYNALAAATAGYCLGIDTERIISALGKVRSAPMRQVNHTLVDGTQLIDDTYNANPDSMKASLEVLSRLDKSRLHIAVLGDMGELGPDEAALHREVGEFAWQSGVDVLITFGDLAHNYALGVLQAATQTARQGTAAHAATQTARQVGLDLPKIINCSQIEEMHQILSVYRAQKPIILIKGSRFMALERLVEKLLESHTSSVLTSDSAHNRELDTV